MGIVGSVPSGGAKEQGITLLPPKRAPRHDLTRRWSVLDVIDDLQFGSLVAQIFLDRAHGEVLRGRDHERIAAVAEPKTTKPLQWSFPLNAASATLGGAAGRCPVPRGQDNIRIARLARAGRGRVRIRSRRPGNTSSANTHPTCVRQGTMDDRQR